MPKRGDKWDFYVVGNLTTELTTSGFELCNFPSGFMVGRASAYPVGSVYNALCYARRRNRKDQAAGNDGNGRERPVHQQPFYGFVVQSPCLRFNSIIYLRDKNKHLLYRTCGRTIDTYSNCSDCICCHF